MARQTTARSLLCSAAIVAACVTSSGQSTARLTGREWRLVEIDGTPAVTSLGTGGRDAHLQLEADSARVTGFTTCNMFFGSYRAAGGQSLRFSQLGSTKMACVEPERAQQEQRFMAVLQSTDRYAIATDTLTLYAGDQPRARFVAASR